MDVRLVGMTRMHAAQLCRHARRLDRREIEILSGMPFDDAVFQLMATATGQASSVTIDGEFIGIVGIEPGFLRPFYGVPWAIFTRRVAELPVVPFFRASRRLFEEYRGDYLHLENFVWSKNRFSRRWLDFLGFDVYDGIPDTFVHDGEEFHRFEWMAD